MANKNKEEYRKQVQRIKRAMKRLEKHGYMFTESPLPDEEPARPTRQQIENLERMNTERLYYRTVMVDQETGELLAQGRRLTKGERQKQLERKGKLSMAQQYGKMTSTDTGTPVEITDVTSGEQQTVAPSSLGAQIIIHNFKENCLFWRNRVMQQAPTKRELALMLFNRTMNWLEQKIAKYGLEDVADMFEDGANSGVVPNFETFYDELENTQFTVELVKFLKDAGEFTVEQEEDDLVQGVYDYVGDTADEFEMAGM